MGFVAVSFPSGGDLWRGTQGVDVRALREHEADVGRRARGGPLGQSGVVERSASPDAEGLVVFKARTGGVTFSKKWRSTSTTFIVSSMSK
jgi:hypothetical protein